eukprot:1798836-Prymnesium_polylepis.1
MGASVGSGAGVRSTVTAVNSGEGATSCKSSCAICGVQRQLLTPPVALAHNRKDMHGAAHTALHSTDSWRRQHRGSEL